MATAAAIPKSAIRYGFTVCSIGKGCGPRGSWMSFYGFYCSFVTVMNHDAHAAGVCYAAIHQSRAFVARLQRLSSLLPQAVAQHLGVDPPLETGFGVFRRGLR